ncbi:MAG: tRNA (adenosine(37)-N6)-threonylcarbamoyltransferase complex dimerization subunit type 1 TsaB, partial [Acidobacteria bacterium]|nr:tRNA (adenosine(37)-N6)-threonylcarbamoyltransferase complex dimerization subunit type 1 TsaB [Acidobacteriota bacterium]
MSTDDLLVPSFATPLILSLDTATEVSSVAIVQGACVLSSTRGLVQKENSARVLQDIDKALSMSGVKLGDIELFAVATGPGSFTGLRSGLATIKAFASTLNRPVIGVPTLHAIASACGTQPHRVLASLPAGRGEVFAQLLSFDGANAVQELSAPFHVSPGTLLEKAASWGGDLKWAGAGAHANIGAIIEFASSQGIIWCDEVSDANGLTAERKAGWTLAQPCESYAEQIAALGLYYYRQGSAIVAGDLHALYVRMSDAELNEKCR